MGFRNVLEIRLFFLPLHTFLLVSIGVCVQASFLLFSFCSYLDNTQKEFKISRLPSWVKGLPKLLHPFMNVSAEPGILKTYML